MQKDNFTIGNLQLATRLQAFSSNPPFFLTPLDLFLQSNSSYWNVSVTLCRDQLEVSRKLCLFPNALHLPDSYTLVICSKKFWSWHAMRRFDRISICRFDGSRAVSRLSTRPYLIIRGWARKLPPDLPGRIRMNKECGVATHRIQTAFIYIC